MLRLHLTRLYWKWMVRHAAQFRFQLERTIANERVRAQRAVEHAELMERRSEMALIAARADKQQKVTA